MDDLTAALATSFRVTHELNTTAAEHPRFAQYKLSLSSTERQEARRNKILDIQKRRRFDYANHARRLTEDIWDAGDAEDDGGDAEEMEVQTTVHRPGRHYKDQLMYSEWLVEVPKDLENEWLMVACPTGKRRLVVAARGQTIAYSKGGFKCLTFASQLPGGNRGQGARGMYGDSTIVDCLYCEKTKTFYVLDMMYWKNLPIYDSETEFRFYWMHEKLQEIPLISCVRKTNPYKFIPLPSFPCTATTISNSIACAKFEIDGLLFYHKRTHYTFGSTPLVVWLKTYMVPDVLKIAVPYREMSRAPPSYTNYANHLDSVKPDTYGTPPEKPRSQPSRGGRGGGRGRGRGRGGNRRENNMDASESVDDNSSSANSSFNTSGVSSTGDATTPKGRGIMRLPSDFNFGSSPMSPFGAPDCGSSLGSEHGQQVPMMSAEEAIAKLNARAEKEAESSAATGEYEGEQEGGRKSAVSRNKKKNRSRKGRPSRMDVVDGQ